MLSASCVIIITIMVQNESLKVLHPVHTVLFYYCYFCCNGVLESHHTVYVVTAGDDKVPLNQHTALII